MKIDIITLFPEMLRGFLETSMMKKAVESNYVQFNIINPRDFTEDKHRTTDDRPFGGGPGMIMKPKPLVMEWREKFLGMCMPSLPGMLTLDMLGMSAWHTVCLDTLYVMRGMP